MCTDLKANSYIFRKLWYVWWCLKVQRRQFFSIEPYLFALQSRHFRNLWYVWWCLKELRRQFFSFGPNLFALQSRLNGPPSTRVKRVTVHRFALLNRNKFEYQTAPTMAFSSGRIRQNSSYLSRRICMTADVNGGRGRHVILPCPFNGQYLLSYGHSEIL